MDKEKDVIKLAKVMLLYEFLYITTNKTKIVDRTVKNLKRYLRNILMHQKALYRASEAKKEEVHSKAWNTIFGSMETSKVISLGIFIQDIYESEDMSLIVGKKTMDKVLSSYFFSDKHDDEVTMEKNSNLLAKEVLKLLDGEKELTPFQKRMQEMKIGS